ncbi:MAG TPA: hypothetical protein VGB94_11585 [Acidobacteriaceae bacterium]
MRRLIGRIRKFSVIVPLLMASSLLPAASLRDIHRDKLSQDESVQNALDQTKSVEELVIRWTDKWNADIPKSQVQTMMSMGLAALSRAAKASPQNEELLLATALEAHYAYNVDVDGAESQLILALEAAHKLRPDDYRTTWFMAYHQCQTLEADKGMKALEKIEIAQQWQQLPISFWDDYIACTITTNVPSHGLRAFDRMKQIYPRMANARENMRAMLQGRSVASDPKKEYEARQIWSMEPSASDKALFTSFICGMSFVVKQDDSVHLDNAAQGKCVVSVKTGPYHGSGKPISPTILAMSLVAPPNGSLEDFLKAALHGEQSRDISDMLCPAEKCLSAEAIKPKAYGSDGDGDVQAIAFERSMPLYPGLIYEDPAIPSVNKADTQGMIYLHPDERISRFPGKLYYLIVMDSATSVLDDARRDYSSFLKTFVAE